MRHIDTAQAALARFELSKREIESELPPLRDPHEVASGHEALMRNHIERALRQIESGFDLEEATDPRLGDLVRDQAS